VSLRLRPRFYRADSWRSDVAFRVDGPDDYDDGLFRGAVLLRSPMGWSVHRVGLFFVGVLDGSIEMEPPR